jgi:hypothetical protein
MKNINSLPRIDLSDMTNSELKNVIIVDMHVSDKIFLDHYIKMGEKELLLGTSKVVPKKDCLYFDFDPYIGIFNELSLLERFGGDKVLDVITKKSHDSSLSRFRTIFDIQYDKGYGSLIWNSHDALGFIKGYAGKFDVVSYVQSLDNLKNAFSTALDKFSVKNVNITPEWRDTLKKMGMNVGKIWYRPLSIIGAPVDETFNNHYTKAHSYAQKNGLI